MAPDILHEQAFFLPPETAQNLQKSEQHCIGVGGVTMINKPTGFYFSNTGVGLGCFCKIGGAFYARAINLCSRDFLCTTPIF